MVTYKPCAILVHGKTLSDCSHTANSYPCSLTKHSCLTLCTSPFPNKKAEERPANEEIQEHRLCQKIRLIKALRVGPSTRTTKYHRQLHPQPPELLIASRWQGYQGLTKDSKNHLTNSQESLLEAASPLQGISQKEASLKLLVYALWALSRDSTQPTHCARSVCPQTNFLLQSTRH